MQRYIDAEELMKEIKKCKFEITGCGIMYHAGNVQSAINFAPTADVVPKSECKECGEKTAKVIENLQVELEAMRGAANSYKMHYENVKKDVEVWKQNRFNIFQMLELYKMTEQEVAKEIFAEIEFDIHNLDFDREETRAIAIEGIIANAKKKYTEGESNGSKQ